MAICDAAGPTAMVCSVTWSAVARRDRLDQLRRLVAVEGLHNALRDQTPAPDERQRQQDVEDAARQIDPEVADRLRRTARKAADQRDQDRHAGRRRDEVLHRQTEHLGQIAHGRFAAVALPVGIAGEADRRVERRIRGHRRGQILRTLVERQPSLQSLQRIDVRAAPAH